MEQAVVGTLHREHKHVEERKGKEHKENRSRMKIFILRERGNILRVLYMEELSGEKVWVLDLTVSPSNYPNLLDRY